MVECNIQDRAVEHLSKALDAEEHTEKHFHIREALQLLSMEDRESLTME